MESSPSRRLAWWEMLTSEAKLRMWVNKEFLSCFHRQDEICTRTPFSSYSYTWRLASVSPTWLPFPPITAEEPSLLLVQIWPLHPCLGFHFPSFSGNACYCLLCIGAVLLFFKHVQFSLAKTRQSFLYPMISSTSFHFAARFLKAVPWYSHLYLCPQHHLASDSYHTNRQLLQRLTLTSLWLVPKDAFNPYPFHSDSFSTADWQLLPFPLNFCDSTVS